MLPSYSNGISIPYSTIKSLIMKNLVNSLDISIPYSTIKSSGWNIGVNAFGLFQFLIVRLKVLQLRQKEALQRISIPYSTIKSCKRR